jgi:hypothetical protein
MMAVMMHPKHCSRVFGAESRVQLRLTLAATIEPDDEDEDIAVSALVCVPLCVPPCPLPSLGFGCGTLCIWSACGCADSDALQASGSAGLVLVAILHYLGRYPRPCIPAGLCTVCCDDLLPPQSGAPVGT